MTPQQLANVKIGDRVMLTDSRRMARGKVTQTTPTWFTVVWYDGTPQIVRRDWSPLAERLGLEERERVT